MSMHAAQRKSQLKRVGIRLLANYCVQTGLIEFNSKLVRIIIGFRNLQAHV